MLIQQLTQQNRSFTFDDSPQLYGFSFHKEATSDERDTMKKENDRERSGIPINNLHKNSDGGCQFRIKIHFRHVSKRM